MILDNPFVSVVIECYAEVISIALPITLFIGACNIGINVIVSAFLGGRIHLGGR